MAPNTGQRDDEASTGRTGNSSYRQSTAHGLNRTKSSEAEYNATITCEMALNNQLSYKVKWH